MKTTIFNKKAHAFFGAAALLFAAVFTIGCKTEISSSDPAPETFTVEMKAGEHGTVTASPAIPTSGKVAKDTVITFTANPTSGYKVEKWTITGGTFEAGTGTDGSPTAKVKISVDTKVNVSFMLSIYAIVPFGTNGAGLDNHLKNTAPHTDGIYYIKVTGLTAADLKGDSDSLKPSPLGKILNDNPTKKVALKLDEVSGLTDMTYCFLNCTSLTQAPEIPNGVTDMLGCFSNCTSLTQAPVIPSSVTNMNSCFYNCKKITAVTLKCNYNAAVVNGSPAFKDAFKNCEKLTAGSIKVPAGQVAAYQAGAATMGTTADRFVAE